MIIFFVSKTHFKFFIKQQQKTKDIVSEKIYLNSNQPVVWIIWGLTVCVIIKWKEPKEKVKKNV